MRISDWSSDVCSSDLVAGIAAESLVHLLIDALWLQRHLVEVRLAQHVLLAMLALPLPGAAVLQLALCLPLSRHRDEVLRGRLGEIGRASCRERVCQYV